MYDDSCTAALAAISECREPAIEVKLPTHVQLKKIPPAKDKIVVAVYEFQDLTGQRKSKDNIASFSTAVTQGGTEMLIDALKTAGGNTWFRVVERAGIDNLVRERQIIRSTREEHDEDKGIQPLLFAGIIIEGGIIGYDSNIESGGRGARYLGIGRTSKYRRDAVTVSLRGVSTLTGEVLLNVQAKKTIFSYGTGFDVFKFVDMDTELVEYEDGVARNESVTYATRAAIEAAVVALIEQGDARGFWTIQRSGENSEEKGK
tara:strand:+ start:1941 stop:2720 length:780 start_codon:yes stop_codon:yes gene_type:complete